MDMQSSISAQYRAALGMLRQAILECPDELWDAPEPANKFWQVAYHALFYTHLYLQPSLDEFSPWQHHRAGAEAMGHLPAGAEAGMEAWAPYQKAELIAYLEFCVDEANSRVAAVDFGQPSGFDWLPFDKLQLQFYNLRHLQHHVGELCERLGTLAQVDVKWIGRA